MDNFRWAVYELTAGDPGSAIAIPFDDLTFFEGDQDAVLSHYREEASPHFTVEVGSIEHVAFQHLVD